MKRSVKVRSKQLKQFIDGFAEERPAERRVRISNCERCGDEVHFTVDEERPKLCERCKKTEEEE
jgi:hypothetical protein